METRQRRDAGCSNYPKVTGCTCGSDGDARVWRRALPVRVYLEAPWGWVDEIGSGDCGRNHGTMLHEMMDFWSEARLRREVLGDGTKVPRILRNVEASFHLSR